MDTLVFTAINRLLKINRVHKRRIESQVAEIGVHRTQHRILMVLARTGHLPSQKQLAQRFDLTPAAITGAVQRLESDGYIARSLGADNRFNEITITDKGREMVETTRERFAAVDETFFEGFSEQELVEFSAYLERIIENVGGSVEHETVV